MGSVLIDGLVILAAGLFVFSLIVIIHELGHFWTARAFGVRIETFSIGFGRTLARWTDARGTVWRLAALPLGGYVKFFGDASAASVPDRTRLAEIAAAIDAQHGPGAAKECFHFKPLWQRALVVAAGPIANFILAFVIFALVVGAFGERGWRPQIAAVVPDSPAAAAGFQAGDVVTTINGRPVRFFHELERHVALSAGDAVRFGVERGDGQRELTATIGRGAKRDPFGFTISAGFLGVSLDTEARNWREVRYGPVSALGRGAAMTYEMGAAPVRYIGRIFEGRESGEHLGGITRIAVSAGKIAKMSFEAGNEGGLGLALLNTTVSLLMLAGALSVGVGLLNLLPLPILDGGHLVYYGYEAVAGRPLAEGAQIWGFRIGLALVVGLVVFVTWNDLRYLRVFEALGSWFS